MRPTGEFSLIDILAWSGSAKRIYHGARGEHGARKDFSLSVSSVVKLLVPPGKLRQDGRLHQRGKFGQNGVLQFVQFAVE